MNVLVDTDVWSEALRKGTGENSSEVRELRELITESRVVMIGIVRMEILSGIREPSRFVKIQSILSSFPDTPLSTEIFVTAASFLNLCRSKGIQGSNNDFIICACSALWQVPIMTKDKDYQNYAKYLPLELYTRHRKI